MHLRRMLTGCGTAIVALALCAADAGAATIVRFTTSLGNFDIQMFDTTMPRTVTNFLHYVNSDKYNGTVVHRNSDTSDTVGGPLRDFVIQGGGFSLSDPVPPATIITQSSVVTIAPILDEPGGGVAGPSNLRGTIAMAKSGPNTVTSQWFINQGNNSFLDSPARSDGGFSAFGKVLNNGMTVVDAIGDLPLPPDFGFSISAPFNDLPLRNFSGNSIDDIRVQHTVTVTDARVLAPSLGDFDLNGVVNSADFAKLKTNFGLASGALFDQGDANMDGRINGADFILFQRASNSAPIMAVPEPAAITLAIVALMGVAMLGGRRLRAC